MRKRTDSLLAIGSLAAVIITPTVLLLLPQGHSEPAGGKALADGSGPAPEPAQATELVVRNKQAVPEQQAAAPLGNGGAGTGGGTGGGTAPAVEKPVPGPSGGADRGQKGTYAAADDGAKITAVKWLGKYEVDLTVSSPALGSTRKVRVLVPKGWKHDAARAWSTLYVFHGGNDSYVSWTRSTDIESLAIRYDALVVMPEGANGSYTNWYNGGKGGTPRWETFHTVEVRQLMERNFRSGRVRSVMGISSGAQGAMTYAGRHPGYFKYVAGFSGVMSMLSPGIPSLLMYTNTRPGTDPEAIWGNAVADHANWVAHDPYNLLPKLKGTRLYISSGNGKPGVYDTGSQAAWDVRYLSESQVFRTAQDFIARAKQLGVPVTADLYGNGSHTWPYWQREMHKVWPALMVSISAKRV
ncbi:alpha/beta hydrolase [Actinomadura parmotrematis]|uniref:Esterase family protein n=1 Tax=Actinomadura parmotrematis TaxID=2864039 RepID=A0ABS7FNB9_9ACTN|nr:alpha/beta hydrolase family protein [Actinomadura parmotrematis]MBW8481720.1 esterase family protein [Actinomadura parmotrematis]